MDINQYFTYPANLILDVSDTYGYAREPVLRRMPDGSLICTFLTGGPTEPHNDNITVAVRSRDDGETWSKPFVVFQHKSRAAYVSEIFTHGVSPCMFVHTYDAPSRYREITAFRSFTEDSGITWSEPRSVPGGASHISVRRGIVLSNGFWLFPVYWQSVEDRWDWTQIPTANDFHMHWPSCCGVLISYDKGLHFELHGDLKSDCLLFENNCIEVEPGHVVMLMRAQWTGWLYRSDSYDYGCTWSEAVRTDIPNASTKITLLREGGNILLIHNPIAVGSEAGMTDRVDLSIWVSDDNMRSWKTQKVLTTKGTAMFYPDGFLDKARRTVYLACENARQSFLLRIPYSELFQE